MTTQPGGGLLSHPSTGRVEREVRMAPSHDLGSFPEFYLQHRAWSRALVKEMLSGTRIDWEGCWNEAWATFSKFYIRAEAAAHDQGEATASRAERFLREGTAISSELEDAVKQLRRALMETDIEALRAASEQTAALVQNVSQAGQAQPQGRSTRAGASSVRSESRHETHTRHEGGIGRAGAAHKADGSEEPGNTSFGFTGPPERYLRRCLVNQARGALRDYLRSGEPILAVPVDRLEQDGPLADRQAQVTGDGPQHVVLAAALSLLSGMQRAVIVTWAWMEPPPTYKELGDHLGISASAARTHMQRALDKLHGIYEP